MENILSKYWILMLYLGIISAGMISCENDDEGDVPVINSVRLTDPEKKDSTFTDATRGTMIVIEGENLNNAQKIYINGQEVSFNPTYNTSTDIILTIPSDLELVDENPEEYSNVLRVETSHGTATFAFHILAPEPYANSYELEWIPDGEGNLEIRPGQSVTITGGNFYEVQRIYTADVNPLEGTPAEEYDITEYQISGDFTKIIVTMPQTILTEGYFIIECYSGTAVLPFQSTPPSPPVITSVSSDMPIVGETVTVYGSNFNKLISVEIGNKGIEIPAASVTVNETKDKLSFVFPSIPSEGGTLTVRTNAGYTSTNFYVTGNTIMDFSTYGAWAWGADNYRVTASNGKSVTDVHSGEFEGMDFDGNTNDWDANSSPWIAIQTRSGNRPGSIPAETPVSDINLRFEIFIGYDLGTTEFYIVFNDINKTKPDGYQAKLADMTTDEVKLGHWMTCSLPLSTFTTVEKYGDYQMEDWGWANNPFLISISNLENNHSVRAVFYIDNIRFYVNQ